MEGIPLLPRIPSSEDRPNLVALRRPPPYQHNDVNRRPLSGHLISALRTIKRRLIPRSRALLRNEERRIQDRRYFDDAITRENL